MTDQLLFDILLNTPQNEPIPLPTRSKIPTHTKDLVLRDYQNQAIERILWAQKLPGNDICVLPTGAGKSVVIANLANRLKCSILILQPSKEILEQNYKKLTHYVGPDEIGIYSASMNEKTIRKYTFATIQSIYKKPKDFAHFNLVLIDECHLVNPKNLGGMFTTFLKGIGNPKVVGFTATPYRLAQGYTWINKFWGRELEAHTTIKLINRMKPFFWSRIIFNINTEDLLKQGFLCGLRYVNMDLIDHNLIPVNKSKSDFDLEKYETMLTNRQQEILKAIRYGQTFARSILVFCSSVRQAKTLQTLVTHSAIVTSETKAKDRDFIINSFKHHKIQVVFNVGVLTTGFDHPSLDCIVLIRPTRSIALYYQMLGRGVRVADGKKYCTVIDLTSNVRNLGRVETIRLVKEDKWELRSETGSWHNRFLYSFTIKK